ncbi:ABC transporter ATP-binding protein [Hyphomicrobium sp. NDB2Meth4]|uniref:ABC transporter ATP-binding protein n=1 Tax=Hyphomicrobium sp. NDB2Meth4 TaxID=1892846 RepID=UPI000930D9DC|nr:ABC transporter ATP-binding protein [Hyphomicrobium sp. NDB2Meth4]
MCSETVMEANDVSKVYLLYGRPEDWLKQMLVPKIKRLLAPVLGRLLPAMLRDEPRYREFWALKDVTVKLKPRETLGIIGQNGSGKSTLLQIICGTLTPSVGAARSEGRVAALLELGAGFNSDFTGRENVYLNAAIYGLSTAEIDERIQAIIDFAEIGEHIDQPVKTYSSGMFVRLAFSVIANIDADILVIDEALAVGDAYFQQKCMRFLRKFQEHGSIFFVSHDIGAMMSFCDRVVWLHHGRVRAEGKPKEVCEEYLAYIYQKHSGVDPEATTALKAESAANESTAEIATAAAPDIDVAQISAPENGRGFGDRAAEIVGCNLYGEKGPVLHTISGGELARLVINFRANTAIRSVIAGFIVKDRLGQFIFGDNTFENAASKPVDLEMGAHGTACFRFTMPTLAPGTYSIVLSVASGTLTEHVQHHWLHEAIIFNSHADINTGVMLKVPVSSEITTTCRQR